jgi:hypothetical protein
MMVDVLEASIDVAIREVSAAQSGG